MNEQSQAAGPTQAAKLLQSLEPHLSKTRLATFQQPNESEIMTLARYSYNVALCEAMYSTLHLLEISLRNAICRAMSTRDAGTGEVLAGGILDSWLDRPAGAGPLLPSDRIKVQEAKAYIVGNRREVTEGRLIAELGFTFWTGLFSPRYGATAPSDPRLWPSLFPVVFPNLGAGINRKRIFAQLLRIRLTRNRVFHHEPLRIGKMRQQEREMVEVIGWMGDAPASYALNISKFAGVVRAATPPFEAMLQQMAARL